MAGVQSPSDAFTHLQHHQHNDLLGPSMQVRGRSTSLTSSTAHCNPSCQCIVAPPSSQPTPYHTYLSFIRLCGLFGIAWLSCLFHHLGMGCIAHRTAHITVKLQSQSFTFFRKLSEAHVIIFVYLQQSSMLLVSCACVQNQRAISQHIMRVCSRNCFCPPRFGSEAGIRPQPPLCVCSLL